MTGNIIVSTCCLGDMGGGGGRLQPYHPRKHVLTITYHMVILAIGTLIEPYSPTRTKWRTTKFVITQGPKLASPI